MLSIMRPTFCSALYLLSMIPACASVDIRDELSAMNRIVYINKCFSTRLKHISDVYHKKTNTVDQSCDLPITGSGL